MGIFGKKSKKRQVKIFIVEDSKVYAAQLEFFLSERFGDSILTSVFPVSEVLDVKLENQDIPDLIIMDHVLNDKYSDAAPGLDALRKIKQAYPGIELVLHSATINSGLAEKCVDEKVCKFVAKGEHAMEELATIVAGID